VAEETPVAAAAPAAKSSNSGSLIMMIVIVLLSNAIGAGATWFFVRRTMAAVVAPGVEGKEGAGKEGKEAVDMAEVLGKAPLFHWNPLV
jgi:flagellar basal body-associated protein FliL